MIEQYSFLQELNEARMTRTAGAVDNLSSEALTSALLTHIYLIEILRHVAPLTASGYVRKTLTYSDFSVQRASATDLHNLIVAYNNLDDKTILPMLQLKTYLRNITNKQYNNDHVRQFFMHLKRSTRSSNARLRSLHSTVQDFGLLSKEEQRAAATQLVQFYRVNNYRSDLEMHLRKTTSTGGPSLKSIAATTAAAGIAGYAFGRLIK